MRLFLTYISVYLLFGSSVGAQNLKPGNVRRRLEESDDNNDTVGTSGCTRQQWKNGKRNCGGNDGGGGGGGGGGSNNYSNESSDEQDPLIPNGAHGYYEPLEPNFANHNKLKAWGDQRYVGDGMNAYRNTDFSSSEDLPDAGYNGNRKRWKGNEIVGGVPRNDDGDMARRFEANYGMDYDTFERMPKAQQDAFLRSREEQQKRLRQQRLRKEFGQEQGDVMGQYADNYRTSNGAISPYLNAAARERRKKEKEARIAKREKARKHLKGKNLANQIKKDEEAEADWDKRNANIDNYFGKYYNREEASKMNFAQGYLTANREMDDTFREEKRRQVQKAKLEETMAKYFNFKDPQTKAAFDGKVANAVNMRGMPIQEETKKALKKAKKKKDKKKDTGRAVDKLLDNPNFI